MGLFGRRKERQGGSECARCKGEFPELTYVEKHGYLCRECFRAIILEMSQENQEEILQAGRLSDPAEPERPSGQTSIIEENNVVNKIEDGKTTLMNSENGRNEERSLVAPKEVPEEAQETLNLRNGELGKDCCSCLMTKDVVWIKRRDEVEEARRVMLEGGFSQIPVFDDELHPSQLLGLLTDKNIIDHRQRLMELKVDRIMDPPPPTVSPTMGVRAIQELLNHGAGCVIVRDRNSILGIITRANLM